jgi:hypothetical protein
MGRSDEEFLHSSFAKVAHMIDMYADELQIQGAAMRNEQYDSKYFKEKETVRYVTSMKDIEGFV